MSGAPSDPFSTFGELLRYLRQRAQLTQDELGIAVGYSRAHIARLENNQRAPDPAAVRARFVDALHLHAEPALATRLIDLAASAHIAPAHEPETHIPGNLPVPLTSFIGRERELDELAPVSDPAFVPRAIAAALGLREELARPILTILVDHLRDRQLLLLLDNCKHLIDACAQLANTMLRACPNVRILATSREALGISGELAWRVPSLQTPDPNASIGLEQLAQYEAVRLFVERASFALPQFDLTAANAPAVQQICVRLDGIPLALELSAARIRALTPEKITERLSDRFRLLTGGSRNAMPRQQTLRATLDWSYGLLVESESVLLRRLSVFVEGCTLEAVCAGDGIGSTEVLDLLSRLVDKSLVLERDEGGVPRYHLLETVRQYAGEKLAGEKLVDSDEGTSVRDRHLAYFLKLSHEIQPIIDGVVPADQASLLKRLLCDLDNLRRAMDWAAEPSRIDESAQLADDTLTLSFASTGTVETMERLQRLLAQAGPSNSLARALISIDIADIHVHQGEYDQIHGLLENAQAIGLALNHPRILANVEILLALQAHANGEYALARTHLAKWQAILAGNGLWDEDARKAHATHLLGLWALSEGHYPEAQRLLTEVHARSVARFTKNDSSYVARFLGYALLYQGKLDEAALLLRESLVDNQALGPK